MYTKAKFNLRQGTDINNFQVINGQLNLSEPIDGTMKLAATRIVKECVYKVLEICDEPRWPATMNVVAIGNFSEWELGEFTVDVKMVPSIGIKKLSPVDVQ